MSLKLEKEQVLFLAGGLTEVMADLAAPAGVPTESELELEQPVLAEWAVGSMQLAYDPPPTGCCWSLERWQQTEDDPEETGQEVRAERPKTAASTYQRAALVGHRRRGTGLEPTPRWPAWL